MKIKGILLGFILLGAGLVYSQSSQPLFSEYSTNPVFSPGRAYYPTVIFDSSHFGDVYPGGVPYYKMWYSSGTGIELAYSEDGITWNPYGPVSGLANAHHAHVIYDRNGFGGVNCYKMWFWDTSVSIYSLAALKAAVSPDGINWVSSSLTQDALYPLVTGVSPDWNRGTYGPVDVFYNPSGSSTLDDVNVWNNRYVMYYDGTTGGIEQVGLAYSVDGLHWKRYGNEPVLPITPGAWDSSYAGFGTVIRVLGGYHFFYSGGQSAIHEGIGYAFSSDGISWQKAAQPIFHTTDGVSWRTVRCYTPSVIMRVSSGKVYFYLWFTGDDGTTRAIGYAVGMMLLPNQEGMVKERDEQDIQRQMAPLARNNFIKCCDQNERIALDLLDSLEEIDTDTPEYLDALYYLEEARYYCRKSEELISSGNAVAGNYCALKACDSYAKAIQIMRELLT